MDALRKSHAARGEAAAALAVAAGARRGDHSRDVRGGSEGVCGVRGAWREMDDATKRGL